MRFVTFYLIAAIAFGCNVGKKEENIILPVKEIAHKDHIEVERILGKPDTTYTLVIMGKAIFCQKYNKHNIEIQYPNSKATDIIVYGPHQLPFDHTALEAFGLNYNVHPSDYMRNRYIRWSDVGEFSAISFYDPQIDTLDNIVNYTIFFKTK